jgi:hypothetical protein
MIARRRFAALMGGMLALPRLIAGSSRGLAQDGAPHRFLLLYLDGGWTSHLATDPVVGARLETGKFQDVYNSHDIRTPPGKDQLLTGIGFQDALPAFAAMPTAFVNGLNVAITAHDAAAEYILTGKSAIGRSQQNPAVAAQLGAIRGGIGSHVVLGGRVPVGDLLDVAPPLETSGNDINDLVSPPGNGYKPETQAAIEAALAATDEAFYQSIGARAQASLTPFKAAQRDVVSLFAKFGGRLELSEALKARYAATRSPDMQNLAAAFLVLQTDLSAVVTVRMGNFDTHSNELGTQLPRQQAVAKGLATLVQDLRNAADPSAPSLSLADTTTILLTSEFVRTPKYNDSAGTDHQNSASAIVMGKGVEDNVVVGRTDDNAMPLGWVEGRPVPKTDETMIDGSTLAASVLALFGKTEQANQINPRRIDGLFK